MTTVAIVGYGYWGPNLLRNYMDLPGAQVRWVCDLNEQVLGKASGRYPGVPTSTDFQSVLGDPELDAVVLATPISTHHRLAKAALQAGKHVFVEKPLAADVDQAAELLRLADELGLTLMVGHTFVYSPPVRTAREILQSQHLGEVRFISSQRVNLGLHQKDVSVIWDLATHDLSIIDYWLGESPAKVSAMGRACVQAGIPDVAFVSVEYPSGVVANVEVSWLSPVKLRRTALVGSMRMLLYDDTQPVEKIKVYDHGVDFRDPGSFGEFQLSYRTGEIVSPHVDSTEPLQLEARHFLECVESGARPLTDAASGLRVVATLAAAEASLHDSGNSVAVELPDVARAVAGEA